MEFLWNPWKVLKTIFKTTSTEHLQQAFKLYLDPVKVTICIYPTVELACFTIAKF